MEYALIEIVSAGFDAVTREMCASLIRTAFSPNIKERADCSTALVDIAGRTLSLTTHAPAHLGSTLNLVPQILSRFPPETLRPGDVFLANDPYIVGVTHLNDCTVTAPFFFEGRPVAFVCAVAHHSDVGGRVPGSESADCTSIFQEGLRIPPIKLCDAGELRPDILELFMLNSRTPHFAEGDLMAQVAATERGIARMTELYRKYGYETIEHSIGEILDASERRMRAGIEKVLRPGSYSAVDWLDDDGVSGPPVRLAVTVTVQDGGVEFDFSECPGQLPSGKNVPLPHVLATVYFCLKAYVDPRLPTNEGLFRVVSVKTVLGSVTNPKAPAAVSSRNMTAMVLADTISNALGQAAPTRALASGGPAQGTILSGDDPARGYFIDYENFAGGQGARALADGMDGVQLHMSNTSNLPIEAMELEFPVRVERYELLIDSAGAGKQRGGLGVIRDLRVLANNAKVALRSSRQKFPAQGLAGGLPGGLGAFVANPDSLQERRLPSTSSETPLANGDLLRVITPGGGGYGEPRARDRKLVQQDLEEGFISMKTARDIYGLDF